MEDIKISDIISIIQSGLLFGTLIVTLFQLKSLQKQTKELNKSVDFQNTSNLHSRHIDVHRFLIEHPKLSKHFGYHSENDTESKILDDHYVMYTIDSFELVFALRNQGLVPDYIWEKSLDNFKHIIAKDRRFELFWRMPYETLRGKFDENLCKFMQDNLMGKERV